LPDVRGPLPTERHKGKSGRGNYNDIMVAHDEDIGRMLVKLDELSITDETIVMYTTDKEPPTTTVGPTPAPHRSGPRRTPIGKAVGAFFPAVR